MQDIQIAGNSRLRSANSSIGYYYRVLHENVTLHPGEISVKHIHLGVGYGYKIVNRDNPQPRLFLG